jgi:hypothetical protein
MLDDVAAACPEHAYVAPAWAIEAAASAPRISPADAAPLIAIFRDARSACSAATVRFRERETAVKLPRPSGCPCGHLDDAECIRHQPLAAVA